MRPLLLGNNRGFSITRLLTMVVVCAALGIVAVKFLKRPPAAPATPVPAASGPAKVVQPAPPAQQQAAAQSPTTPVSLWPPIDGSAPVVDLAALLRRNYYVILDGSGSMREKGCSGDQSKFVSATTALADFFATIPSDANVGLFIFDNNGFSERVPLGVGNRDQLQAMLMAAKPNGGTPLSAAVEAGFQALTTQAGQQLGYGEYHLVIVTDGEASKGYEPSRQVNRIIDQTSIVIHTIGYCIGEGHSLNQPGRTLYSTAADAPSLSRELKAVLAESESFDVAQFQ